MTNLEDYDRALAKLENTIELLEETIRKIGEDCIDKDGYLYSEMKEKLDRHKRGFNSYIRTISQVGLGKEK